MGKLIRIHKNVILNEDDVKSIVLLYCDKYDKPYVIEIEHPQNYTFSYKTKEEAEEIMNNIHYLK